MATNAHDETRYIADQWETFYASAVLSGIVGDAAHQKNGGYHISIEDQSSSNYSVTRPDDKAPPGTWPRNLAAAIDMSMSSTDMKTCSDRLWAVWNDRANDPRAAYVNGFNGWFNDGGPAKRYDYYSGEVSDTTSDHKWHVHLEIRRKYVTDRTASNAIISILRGDSKEDYLIGDAAMFCFYGETSDKVKAMQLQLLQLDPTCLPKFGADWNFGNETQAALNRLVTGVNVTYYGPEEWAKMQKLIAEKFGPTNGGGTSPIKWPLKGTVNFPGVSKTFEISIPPAVFEIDINEAE